jgi:hypothetical protein
MTRALEWILILAAILGSVSAAGTLRGGDEARAKEKPAGEAGAGEKPAEPAADAGKAAPEGEATAGKEEKKERPEEPPEPPTFRLRDGTRIAGFPQVERITIDTAYGRLVVPTRDIVRVRFAREDDPEMLERIRGAILKLGDEEFEVREEAMAALLDIGVPALKLLRQALESDDEEVKSRAQTLVGKIEETVDEGVDEDEDEAGVPIAGEDDEVVTLRFTAKGKIEERLFEVQSGYGPLKIDRKNIISIVFQENAPSEVEVSVPATAFAGANRWHQTKITVKKGAEITIAASGQVVLQNYGHAVDPDGSTQTPTKQFLTFNLGALVARVGNGKPFLVGKSYRGRAPDTGKLAFGTAIRSGQVTGTFEVKVRLPEEE